MMMGKTCMATAVRDPNGEIQIEAKRLKKSEGVKRASKIPFVRGIVNLISSLILGTGTLMRTAAVYGDEDEDEQEEGKFQKWLAEKFQVSLMDVVTGFSAILGVLLAIGIFIFLPRFLITIIPPVQNTIWEYILLGVFKLVIFIAYLASVGLLHLISVLISLS